MCHCRRVAYERLNSAETFRKCYELQALKELFDVVVIFKLKGDHDAAVFRLPAVDLVAFICRKSRIVNAFDCAVLGEELCGYLCVRNVTVEPYAEGLDASDEKKAVKRREHAACGVLNERYLFGKLLCFGNCKTCNNVAVTAEIFCCAVNDDVCAKLYRSLQIWCHKCVIDDHEQVVLVSYLSYLSDVGNGHQRVCGAFKENCLDIIGDILFKRLGVFGIGDRIAYIKMVKHVIEESERSAVDI